MFAGNEAILQAVNQECRRAHQANLIDILEPILYQVFQNAARLILRNCSYRLKCRHQQQAARFPLARDVRRRARSNTPTKQNDILFIDAHDFVYVIINVERIRQNIFLIGLKQIIPESFMPRHLLVYLRFARLIFLALVRQVI